MGYYSDERKRNLAYVLKTLVSSSIKLGESDWISLSQTLAGIEMKFGVTTETASGYLDTLERSGLIDIDPKSNRIDVLEGKE